MQNRCSPRRAELGLWLTSYHVFLRWFEVLSPAAGCPGRVCWGVCVRVMVVQRPGGGGCWPLAVVLGTGDELGGCVAMPSAAGPDGQTAGTDGQPGELWLQDLVEP